VDQFDVVWGASDADVHRSPTASFMKTHDIASFSDLVQRSTTDIEWFWSSAADFLGIPFSTPYESVLDTTEGIAHPRWFDGATINLSEACVDRWADDDPTRVALVAEREDGTQRTYTFGDLRSEIEYAAGAIREAGARKGDTVAVYLPMSAEVIIAMLAIACIGAVFAPIFSGYGAEAVASPLKAARPKVLIAGDGYQRRGSVIAMKEVADAAIAHSGVAVSTLVVRYVDRADTRLSTTDRWWHEALAVAEPASAVPTASEDPRLVGLHVGHDRQAERRCLRARRPQRQTGRGGCLPVRNHSRRPCDVDDRHGMYYGAMDGCRRAR
jgi:acetyl-CoA synthetase